MEKNMSIKDALEKSLEMEETGCDFYTDASKKAVSNVAKKIFKALAEDEKRHIKAIEKYAACLAKGSETPDFTGAMPAHKDISQRVMFGSSLAEMFGDIGPAADELEAYQTAMKMEKEGYNFYKKAHGSINDKNIKDLYEFLITEEKAHYKLVFDTYEYLKNPQDLFTKEEKPIIEG